MLSYCTPYGFRISLAAAAAIFSSALVVQSAFAQSGDEPAGAAGAGAPPEVGIWYDDTQQGAVEITQCGASLCGHIVWLKKPLTDEGTPIKDIYNVDTSKRTRHVCGIQVIGDVAKQPDGTYDNGWVYDPKIGRAFNVAINMLNENQLHVRGYAKIKLFGKSLTWTRAPNDLERCTTGAG